MSDAITFNACKEVAWRKYQERMKSTLHPPPQPGSMAEVSYKLCMQMAEDAFEYGWNSCQLAAEKYEAK